MSAASLLVLDSGGSRPLVPPTRDEVCSIRNSLQGITVRGRKIFDPEIGWSMAKPERLEAYTAHRAVKLPDGTPRPDTHICLSLDMTGLACLPHIKSVIKEAVTEGGMTGVILMCMGDGNDVGEPDHDPGALGFSWIMANFNAIVDFMEVGDDGEDLTQWIVFGPGFDGIIPAWQPWSRVNQFVRMARLRLNRLKKPGHLCIEFSSGYWSWSGERDDLGTEDGQMIDVPLYEFPINWGPPSAPPANLLLPNRSDWSPSATNEQRAPWTQVWLMNRWLGARYIRPASQPPNYEPNPPYANMDTPRGRKFPNMWERGTYMWNRQGCDIALINQQTQVVIDLGAEYF